MSGCAELQRSQAISQPIIIPVESPRCTGGCHLGLLVCVCVFVALHCWVQQLKKECFTSASDCESSIFFLKYFLHLNMFFCMWPPNFIFRNFWYILQKNKLLLWVPSVCLCDSSKPFPSESISAHRERTVNPSSAKKIPFSPFLIPTLAVCVCVCLCMCVDMYQTNLYQADK